MSRIWFSDYWPALTKTGSVIKLPAGGHVTVGGTQLHLTSDLTATLSGLTANTLYMVYVVKTGLTPSLVVSANYNSTGPAGYLGWKLVGAFYAYDAVTPGMWVNLEGAPKTEWIDFTPTLTSSGGGNITLNGTAPVVQLNGQWRRDADSMGYSFSLRNGSGGAATGTAGTVLFGLLTPFAVNTNKIATSVAGDGTVGIATINGFAGHVWVQSTTALGLQSTGGTDLALSAVTAGFILNAQALFPITGWTANPLKFL